MVTIVRFLFDIKSRTVTNLLYALYNNSLTFPEYKSPVIHLQTYTYTKSCCTLIHKASYSIITTNSKTQLFNLLVVTQFLSIQAV